MVRPVAFRHNEQTAVNNKFQQPEKTPVNVQQLALEQFDNFVSLLQANGITVHTFDDTLQPTTPDSIFPNNWVTFHEDGTAILYPMYAPNRRTEKRVDILQELRNQYMLNTVIDFGYFEASNKFLEGTGSMVLDRLNRIAYMCASQRSSNEVFQSFCQKMDYIPITFEALDENGFPIYHTNVMMCIGTKFAIMHSASIHDANERLTVMRTIRQSGKEIISISNKQLHRFAGNMLELTNKSGQNLLVMSEQAYLSLNSEQIACLEKYAKLIYAPLDVIEKNGGGSARCMIAEILLPIKNDIAVRH
ncbi:amidinotransferase [Olivibacter sp. SDN3]|nr:amidinotransferase [Olivibacter sp. SDN3]